MLIVRDVPYRNFPNERLYFDIYQPEEEIEVPLIAYFHGGYRQGSRKDIDMRLLQTLVDNGYAVATVEYRLAPAFGIAEILEDCQYAVNWMIANLDGCGLDLGRIGAWGLAAGGRIAALLGTMGAVDAVFDNYGSSNLGQENPPEALLAQYDPVSYINKQSAPFLIVHGKQDKQIPIEQSERLHRALQAKRIESQLLILEEAGHEIPDVYLPAVSAAMLRFFRKHLG